MLWSLGLLAAIGALIGTRFRAPALLAASAAVLAVVLAAELFRGAPAGAAFLRGLAAAAALQLGYLLGAGGAVLWRGRRR